MEHRRPAVHSTIVVMDIEGFTEPMRTLRDHRAVRDGLYRSLHEVFDRTGVSWDACLVEDRGDGVFILVPPEIPKALFVDVVPGLLSAAIREHNANNAGGMARQIRLRLALHAGEVNFDEFGVTSSAIILAFRLLDSRQLKKALADSMGVLAMITSEWFFDEVVRHGQVDPVIFRRVRVKVRERHASAWIAVPHSPVRSSWDARNVHGPDFPRPSPYIDIPLVTQNTVNDSMADAVIQAGIVYGDVHLHHSRWSAVVPHQLPAAPRWFTGRTRHLTQLTEALGNDTARNGAVPIVAIRGAGGMGKTALALYWAHRNIARFPDGDLYADLRGFDPTGPQVAPQVILRGFLDALGVPSLEIPADLNSQIGLYRTVVAGRRLLIVLDNARDFAQLQPLLPGSSSCVVLVTSRDSLARLVLGGAHVVNLKVLTSESAKVLLTRHIGERRVAAEPDAVADLLEWAAGLPLAIGVIAARAAMHPDFALASLADELRDADTRLDGLDIGPFVNLRTAFDLSRRALATEIQPMLLFLAIAPGPDISFLASVSLLAQPMARTRLILRMFEEAHLIEQHSPGRYQLHDLFRLYAKESAEREIPLEARQAAIRRLVDYYAHTAYAARVLIDPEFSTTEVDPPVDGCSPHAPIDVGAARTWLEDEFQCLFAAQEFAFRQKWRTQSRQVSEVIFGLLKGENTGGY